MTTPVVIHVTCPRCGADVPGLLPGQRRPCPYCKTELAMPRLDPTRAEMPQTVMATVATPRSGAGCAVAALVGVIGALVVAIMGAAFWAQRASDERTARRVGEQLEQVRRAQQSAFDQVHAAQRQASCEARAAVRCERECRLRPAKCDECLPRERGACAAP